MAPVDREESNTLTTRHYNFREAVQTDIGKKRKENQDSYGVAHSKDVSLYIVADGMGGARGGGTASALAVNVIAQKAFLEEGVIDETSLKEAIELSNSVIFARSGQDEELSGMGTTVVALVLSGKKAIVAHVGDSRIYRFSDGELEQLTRDHTLVQELVETGAIMPEDAANHPIAHMLTRSLGPTESVEVETCELEAELSAGQKFLLCSDGLYNLVTDDEIAEHLAQEDLSEAVNKLVALALERGGLDNVTIEVVEALPISETSSEASYPSGSEISRNLSSSIDPGEIDEAVQSSLQRTPAKDGAVGGENLGAEASAKEPEQRPEDLSESTPEETPEQESVAGSGDPEEESLPGIEELDFVPEESGSESREGSVSRTSSVKEKRSPEQEALYDYNASLDQANSDINRWAKLLAILIGIGLVGGAYYFGRSTRIPNKNQLAAVASYQSSQAKDAELPDSSLQKELEDERTREELLSELSSEQIEVSQVEEENAEVEEENVGNNGKAEEPSLPVDTSLSSESNPPVESLVRPPAEENPPVAELSAVKAQEIAALKQQADSLDVPPPPRVEIPGAEKKGRSELRPIIWEKESKRLDKLQQETSKAREAQQQDSKNNPAPLLSNEEMRELIERKKEVRIKIADLDAKIEILALETKEQALGKKKEVESDLIKNEEALANTTSKLEKAERRLRRWLEIKGEAVGRQRSKIADDVAELDETVMKKKGSYSKASIDYLESVDSWQQQPNDMELASLMGARARSLQQERQELEEAVTIAIATGIEDSIAALGKMTATKENLERQKAHLNRHIGYLEGFTPAKPERKLELRSSYLAERKAYIEELGAMREKVSDSQEREFVRISRMSQFSQPLR